ncbi:aspartyl-tRNA(Asn)/glutamyl-tRNA(Gln) amidotransferase subunit A [Actinoalloteichus hoggarensis]|uniref:Glutamyl-tRNA(Gln) amidotransferase subunit A n=1 Tax=Actinoalloteichus hoggarensis TaxID=1470176 RepID=A0A221W692_9PSEU|nr:amidase [Actinoalloteichus hoggarensis]ASO21224.1 Glutamyl-tRNA(Gln) amidotransferase subunit A [Actinoalloteichus hoggarensis]MBB5921154.1 aspartyl-tRNA(Asn)/glutamyl-tRNA(Gln) amidotransferase subunit A [Actinoalloteichus hoggarensis]
MTQPYELSLTEAAQAIAAGILSPTDLVESVARRLHDVEERVTAYATVTTTTALAQAAQASSEIAASGPRGPLHGIPMGIKDLIDVAGVPTSAGSQVRAGRVPAVDASVTTSLRRAGGVLLGKTHTHEFAFGVTTPRTRNPWAFDRVAGGSSGGSAVAVAAGSATAALGTDTGGSIRIPAALCGVVGLKPTFGLVSTHGVTPLAWSMDHVGPITRTVADAAAMLDAVAGHDPRDPASLAVAAENRRRLSGHELTGLRVGVPRDFFFDHVDVEVEHAVRAAVATLAELGATLVEVAIPMGEYLRAVHSGLLFTEAAAYHRHLLRTRAEHYGDDVRTVLEAGELLSATDHLRAQRARRLLRQRWASLFESVDVLAAPTVPVTAVETGRSELRWADGTRESVTDAYVRLAAPANLTGGPALSVPVGFDAAGLPIGMQLIGRPLDEATLVQVGGAYEYARGKAGLPAPC